MSQRLKLVKVNWAHNWLHGQNAVWICVVLLLICHTERKTWETKVKWQGWAKKKKAILFSFFFNAGCGRVVALNGYFKSIFSWHGKCSRKFFFAFFL